MKRLAGLSVLSVLVVTLAVPAQEGAPANPYYPLKDQATWVYDVQGGPITVKVVGKEKVKDTQAYKLETSAGGKVSATETVGITKDGIVRFNVNGLAPEAPILFLPTDPEATKEWSVDTKVGNETIKGTFKATKEQVVLANGTKYDTIYVKGADMKIGNTTTTVEYWFAKDVGIVKLKFTLGAQDATLELTKYTAGK
jgi:hypothetical protein